MDDIKVGDYVYAQGGVLVRKIPEEEAIEILKQWKEIFFELKKTDEALAKIDTDKLPPNVLGVLQKINLRKSLKQEEILALSRWKIPMSLKYLYEIA